LSSLKTPQRSACGAASKKESSEEKEIESGVLDKGFENRS